MHHSAHIHQVYTIIQYHICLVDIHAQDHSIRRSMAIPSKDESETATTSAEREDQGFLRNRNATDPTGATQSGANGLTIEPLTQCSSPDSAVVIENAYARFTARFFPHGFKKSTFVSSVSYTTYRCPPITR